MKNPTKLLFSFTVLALVLLSIAADGPGLSTRDQLLLKQDTLGPNSNVTVSNVTSKGSLSLSGMANKITMSEGGVLEVDGSPITGGGSAWGGITGTLTDQSDLVAALANFQLLDADLTSLAGGISGLVKGAGNGGGYSAASSGTDYAPATSGSAILKGNGSGGFSSAAAGTDYQAPLPGVTAAAGRLTATNLLTVPLTVSYASSITVDLSGAGRLATILAGSTTVSTTNQANGYGVVYTWFNGQLTNCNVVLPSTWALQSGAVTNIIPPLKSATMFIEYVSLITNTVVQWASE